jgi:hypothetical protein
MYEVPPVPVLPELSKMPKHLPDFDSTTAHHCWPDGAAMILTFLKPVDAAPGEYVKDGSIADNPAWVAPA